jgi:4-hydroxy-2-oxoheptanedioate aldolase
MQTSSGPASDLPGVLGAWCAVPNSLTVEILARAGFDWLCLDWQHGFLSASDLVPMVQAAAITATPVFVRVGGVAGSDIARALDSGVAGVIVPMINNSEDAKRAAQACRYAPEGIRSWGPTRITMVSPTFGPREANAKVVCIAMIETRDAVENLDSILDVAGIDRVFVGPSDLAVSLGERARPGPIAGEHASALEKVSATCRARGIPAGIHCGTSEAALTYLGMGFSFLTVISDAALLRAAANSLVSELRGKMQGP